MFNGRRERYILKKVIYYGNDEVKINYKELILKKLKKNFVENSRIRVWKCSWYERKPRILIYNSLKIKNFVLPFKLNKYFDGIEKLFYVKYLI